MSGLPPLRQDLSLHPGPPQADGAPTWSLHDPAANRFYRLGWSAFEILSRWQLGEPRALLAALAAETTLRVDRQDVLSVLEFLSAHHLLDASGAADTARLAAAWRAARPSKAKWLLENYLFFRLPLVRPAAFLARHAHRVRFVYTAPFWLAIGAAALFGAFLVSRRWDEFSHTYAAYTSWSGLLAIGLALSCAKVLHELGHAFTAQRYGCRVPTMGLAFLVMWPVLYTDTNEAWKLPDQRQRLAIAGAGMLSELALAAGATLAWSLLPAGPLQAGAFLLASTTWIITLGINASPFMRFDGYFLLSDWLDLPNLHARAFALGRWWLRRQLFGWDGPAPEAFTPGRRRFLIAFAWGTWLYRLTLFLGIAYLVYHLSFKLLGIGLMAVELGWFICLPVWREMTFWWRRRAQMDWNRASRRSALAAVALLALLLLPWRGDLRAPAVLGAAEAQGLYAARAARVLDAPVREGAQVAAGQVLLRLESIELDHQLGLAEIQEGALHWQLEQQPFDPRWRQEGEALRARWIEAAALLKGLREQREQLTVRAPFAGRVAEANDSLTPGAWVAHKEKLFHLVGPRGARADVFVGEAELAYLLPGGDARFVADAPGQPGVRCRLGAVDSVNLGAIDTLYVASTYGGALPVQRDKAGRLTPTEAVFRVRLEQCDATPERELRGVAHLRGEWHSLAQDFWRRAAGALRRESGF